MEVAKLNHFIKKFCLQNRIDFELFLKHFSCHYAEVVQHIDKQLVATDKKPFMLGISGCQGSGKSTLASLIASLLIKTRKRKVVVISIDDFYKTAKQRQQMARDIHPLFATRGVPGTHDLSLALELMEQLNQSDFSSPIYIPTFDKSIDDRTPENQWQCITEQPDMIILEGWCIGALAQPLETLVTAINQLERDHDSNGKWRKSVNNALAGNYQQLFSLMDYLLFIQAPSFEVVSDWRLQQEVKLQQVKSNSTTNQIMDSKAIQKFVQFFERITRHNLENLPSRANMILRLDNKRHPLEIKINSIKSSAET